MRALPTVLLALLGACTALENAGLQGEGAHCNVPLGEGEPSNCAGDLFCSHRDAICVARSTEGGPCDGVTSICKDKLMCSLLDGTCHAPDPIGSLCVITASCATGLQCNHGYEVDVGLGQCQPLSDVGGPCFYTQYQLGQVSAGCLPSLTCVVPPTTLSTIYTTPWNELCHGGNEVCGYPGVCAPLFTIPPGDACADDGGCTRGNRCNVLPKPWADDVEPGFGCEGNTDCYRGPWPGACGPDNVPLPQEFDDCETTSCAPGFLCDHMHQCRPRFHGSGLFRCDTWPSGEPDDELCMIGRHCEGDPPECVIGVPL